MEDRSVVEDGRLRLLPRGERCQLLRQRRRASVRRVGPAGRDGVEARAERLNERAERRKLVAPSVVVGSFSQIGHGTSIVSDIGIFAKVEDEFSMHVGTKVPEGSGWRINCFVSSR